MKGQRRSGARASGGIEFDDPGNNRVANHRTAFEFISEFMDNGDLMSKGMIREIQRELVDGAYLAGGIPAHPELCGQLKSEQLTP